MDLVLLVLNQMLIHVLLLQ